MNFKNLFKILSLEIQINFFDWNFKKDFTQKFCKVLHNIYKKLFIFYLFYTTNIYNNIHLENYNVETI